MLFENILIKDVERQMNPGHTMQKKLSRPTCSLLSENVNNYVPPIILHRPKQWLEIWK